METPTIPAPPQNPQPRNPGFGQPPQQTTFDNKKATHKEVATFFQNSLAAVNKQFHTINTVLDALFLYLAEVGIVGVKITQDEIADYYKKRVLEEKTKRENQAAQAQLAQQAKDAANTSTPELGADIPGICSSEPSPDSSLTSADSSDQSTDVTKT